jgi:hypothetical protein
MRKIMPIIIDPDPTLKNNLMAFGRECDSGWNKLIDELVEKLNELPEEIYVTQVKEKYGTLRFYIASGSEKAFDIIDLYEEFSSHICEHCGEFYTAKERVSHGWIKILCNKCAIEYEIK